MSSRSNLRLLALAAVAAVLGSAGSAVAQPLNGNWTYQGRLTDAGIPANGSYDIQIAVYAFSAGGAPISVSFHNNVAVTNGLFTLPDVSTGFLSTFQGDRRWAEVQVRPGASGGAFTVLAPRQELTATPYAMWANRAAVAGTVNNHTLDAAYDSGGAGNGRTILADAGSVNVIGAGGVDVETNLRVGDSDTSGVLQMFHAQTSRNFELRGHAGQGGAVEGYDESGGSRTYFIEPDVGGEGGFLSVLRGGFAAGFTVDGSTGAAGDPIVSIDGGTRSMSFSPGASSGNASVVLPVDAISSPEILDEPGAASNNGSGTGFPTQGVFVTLSSRSITIPEDGYVLALGNAEIAFAHVNGTASRCTFGLSTANNSLSINQDFETSLSSNLPTGSYDFTASAHCLFTLSAGTHTIFFLGREDLGNVNVANDTWLSLIYIPTAYGAVASRGEGDGDGPGGDDIVVPAIDDIEVAAERDMTEQLAAERTAREIADLRAQIAELRKLIANPDNKPSGGEKR